MPELLRTLIVEDQSADAELVVRELERAGFDPVWKCVETEEQYVSQLEASPEVILADYTLPRFGAMQALKVLQQTGLDIPFIVVSGSIGEDIAVEAMRQGATDYLLKDRLARLGPAVNSALEQSRSRKEGKEAAAELRSAHEQLRHLLAHSPAVIYSRQIENHRATPIVVSDNVERLFGVRVGGSAHEWWLASLHPDDRERVLHTQSESLAGFGYSMEYRLRHRNGRYRWVEDINRVVRDASGEATEAVGVWTDITERKEANEALQRQGKQYQVLFETYPSPTWVYNAETLAFLAVNDAAVRHYGYSRDEFLAMTIRDIRPQEDVPALLASGTITADQSVAAGIWRHRKKSGEIILTEIYASAIQFEDHLAQLAIAIDVTEKKKAEDAISESEERMRSVLESALDCIITMDHQGRVVEFNPAAEKTFGYKRDGAIGQLLADLIVPPALRERDQRGLAHYLSAGKTPVLGKRVELTGMRSDKSEFPLELAITRIGSQEPPMFTGFIRDITERKQSEDRLREQAELLDLAQDAIMVRDMDDRVEFWNRGAEELYGWTAAEVHCRQASSFLFEDDPGAAAAARTAVLENGKWAGECKHSCKDGGTVTVRSRWTLVRDELAVPESILIINTDITEQKKIEEQFLRAQRLESIGTLASGVAHDLNNILAPILMGTAVLWRTDMPAADKTILSTMETCAQRGADIVKQVLTFARGAEGARLLLQPAHLVRDMAQIVEQTFPKTIAVRVRCSESLWLVDGDPTQLHQVLLNLSVNARDAMPAGGVLTLSVENFSVDEQYASMTPGAKAGSHVLLEVNDTGIGIPHQIIDKVFDPFFTTKELGYGTGLGLSTVIGIVKSHGGFVSVYSEIGRGTTFKIYLPATLDASAAVKETETTPLPPANGELLLIVDDEKPILQVAQALLEGHGYQVLTAEDATEALAIFAMRMNEIDVVLTDLAMPLMDGSALIRTLQKMRSEVRIIASTGRGGQQEAHDLASLNVRAFLTKPYNKNKLLATLHDVLAQPSDNHSPASAQLETSTL
jgi:PAS domain S-box-containing protein